MRIMDNAYCENPSQNRSCYRACERLLELSYWDVFMDFEIDSKEMNGKVLVDVSSGMTYEIVVKETEEDEVLSE